jgi:hypothetical protein
MKMVRGFSPDEKFGARAQMKSPASKNMDSANSSLRIEPKCFEK